jgi:quercetin dioxygenase-like cupin family protein
MRRLPILVFASLTGTVVFAAGTLATPESGLTRTPYGRGAHPDVGTVDIEAGKETVVYSITLDPGGSTGWHTHPGAVIFVIRSGTVTQYGLDGPACTARTLETGQAYIAPDHAHHPHLARNDGTEPVVAIVTAFNTPRGQPSRVDAEPPAECPDLR